MRSTTKTLKATKTSSTRTTKVHAERKIFLRRITPASVERLFRSKKNTSSDTDYRLRLKIQFLHWTAQRARQFPLSDKPTGAFRIASFNVHYFTDIFEQHPTLASILRDIQRINADCVGLQEVLVGGSQIRINPHLTVDVSSYFSWLRKHNYTKHVFCNSVPSWFDGVYGNATLVQHQNCLQARCENLNEEIHTFPKSKHSTVVSGGLVGTRETRCYIRTSFKWTNSQNTTYNLHVFNTHLDVATEAERLSQVRTIIRHSKAFNRPTDVVFVMGDFNTFRSIDKCMQAGRLRAILGQPTLRQHSFFKERRRVVQTFTKSGFIDCHAHLPCTQREMTTWNNTRVDFIMCNRHVNPDGFRAEYLYSLNSDHIPVVLTLLGSARFGIPET
jgi:endonuclease/exonuclease/phosphatase family metal-dependent hydrolase